MHIAHEPPPVKSASPNHGQTDFWVLNCTSAWRVTAAVPLPPKAERFRDPRSKRLSLRRPIRFFILLRGTKGCLDLKVQATPRRFLKIWLLACLHSIVHKHLHKLVSGRIWAGFYCLKSKLCKMAPTPTAGAIIPRSRKSLRREMTM